MTARSTTALLALLMLWPAAATAQAAATGQDDATIHFRIIPRVGAFTPAGWFYEEFAHLGVDPLEWTDAAIMETAVLGLTAELEIGDSGLWIRGEVLRTLNGETRLGHKILHSTDGFSQPYVESVYFWIPSTITVGTLDLAFPLRFRLPFGIQPYVTAGIGGKRYDFDITSLDGYDKSLERPAEGVSWVTNIGGGVTAEIFGISLDLVARDAMSEYWGEQQHDVFWLAGVRWPLF